MKVSGLGEKPQIQFLHNAQGSLSELDTQSIICHELGYFSQEDFMILEEKLEHENKLLTGLIKSLKKSKF
ncbi:hypothetical protein DRN98_10300 [Methanosarcinales archaeon]|nr:MAG: hypothetical protein DRN98_10300 [Methanosarcinales archaeon]